LWRFSLAEIRLVENLGSPKGKITLDVSSVTQARTIVVAAAADMNRAFNSTDPNIQRVANSLRIAQQAARDFADTDLGAIQQSIQGAAQRLAVFSAVAAAASGAGVAAAQSTRQLTSTYAALLNSSERAQAVLTEIRDLSEEYKLHFLEAANGAKGFLAVVNSSNLSMRDLVLTSQRLRLLNQAEGAEGASFALRELLSGDIVSIVERFNISRSAVNEIKAQANGDQALILQGLNEYLDRIGVTEDALREIGQSGANAFARLRSSLTEAASTAFTPFLENVVLPITEGFATFLDNLRETNPGLLQTASIFTVAAAGVAPLLFALNQAISAYRTLKLVSMNPLGSRVLNIAGIIGTTGIAAEIGNQAGIWVARQMADRGIGDQRLRSDSGEDPGAVINERIRQVIFIAAAALYEFAITLQKGKFTIENAVNLIGNAIHLFTLRIVDGALQFVGAIGRVISDLGQRLNLADVKQFGDDLQATVTRLREGDPVIRQASEGAASRPYIGADGQMHIDEGIPVLEEYVGGTIAQIQALEDALANGVALTREQEEALARSRQGFVVEIDAFGESLGLIAPEIEAGAESAAEGVRQGGTSLLEALLSAVRSPAWQELQAAIAENARKIKEANDERLIGVGREAEDFARGRMRAFADERRQNERLERLQLERERQQIAAIEAINTDAARREAELLRQDLQQREQELEAHNQRLLDIQRSGHFAILDAIADGDGVAAIRAVRNVQEQMRKENEDYAERQRQRDRDLRDQRESLADQRDERLRDAVQQLSDMRVQFADQRAEREADFNERLAREDEDRSIRLQREQDDFERRRALEITENDRRIGEMQARFFVETGLWQSFQTTMSTVFQNIRDNGIRYLNDIVAWLSGTDGRGMIGGGGRTADLPFAANGARLLTDGLVYAHAGEVILNQPQQREWGRSVSYQVQVSSPITIMTNEPFNYEDLVEDITDHVTDQVAEVIVRLQSEE
jgi:hypothetical protein